VLALFMDNIESDRASPFGIHSIAKVGLTYRRKPGDWYGPQAICNVLHELNKTAKPLSDFSMVVCNDGNVFLDKIKKKIDRGKSVFVVMPVRLGLNQVEPEYLECLKQVFNFKSSCGIAGG
jgi:cysteine protease ATG4